MLVQSSGLSRAWKPVGYYRLAFERSRETRKLQYIEFMVIGDSKSHLAVKDIYGIGSDWWCRAGRENAVKTRRVEQAVVSRPLPKNYSSRSYESSLDGAASECSNK
ncbi:hypothetical protein TNCV_1082431 [Trichonephila clavipes]|nr:hypothetical protein TNCV_1082431 [Trichonephila clavipes]